MNLLTRFPLTFESVQLGGDAAGDLNAVTESDGMDTLHADLISMGFRGGNCTYTNYGNVIADTQLLVDEGNYYNQEIFTTYGATSTPFEEIGESGSTLVVSGDFINSGVNTVSGQLSVGERGHGKYSLLAGGSLSAASEILDSYDRSMGEFVQTGGTNTAGSLVVGSNEVADDPAVQSYGTYTLGSLGGILTVSGDETIALNVSANQSTFHQQGGTHSVGGTLFIAKNTGAIGYYNLDGGVLNVGTSGAANANDEVIGYGGYAAFQSAGTHTIGTSSVHQYLSVGYSSGSTGSYILYGTGVLTVNGNAYIGGGSTAAGGTGYMIVTPGTTATVNGTLKIWNSTNTQFTQTGGTLNVQALDTSGDPTRFNWTGGTLNVNGGLTIGVTQPLGASITLNSSMTLTSIARYITNDGQVTLAGGELDWGINNSTVGGYGTLGEIDNVAELSQGAGDIVLMGGCVNESTGKIDLLAGRSLIIHDSLANFGTVNVDGATISSSTNGLLDNSQTISGRGLISCALKNEAGGTISAQGGTLTISQPLSNSGTVNVGTGAAVVFSSSLTNSGSVQVNGGGSVTLNSGSNTNSGVFYDPVALVAQGNFTNSGGTTTIGGTQSWSVGTTLSNTGGTTTLLSDAGPSTSAPLKVAGTGGSIVFASNQHLASLNLTGGSASVPASAGGTIVLRPQSLAMTGSAALDLANNKLITASSAGSFNSSQYTGVTGLIQSGRNGGPPGSKWAGGGIVTSQTFATTGNYTTLAVARASDVKPATATATAVWAGQTITGTDTLVMYTYGGDATLDGKINVDDYIKIDSGIAAHLTGWSNGDFNYDGKVNIDDYTQFIDANIGTQGSAFPTAEGITQGVLAIPEPAPAALGILFQSTLLLRRKRSRALRC